MAHTFIGTIVSNKMKSTVTVAIERKMRHPRYQKIITRTKKIKAHTVRLLQVGETVTITSVRPISKTVAFKVLDN